MIKINIPNYAQITDQCIQTDYGFDVAEGLDPRLRYFCVSIYRRGTHPSLFLCMRDKDGVNREWDTGIVFNPYDYEWSVAEGVKYIEHLLEEELVEIDF